MSQIAHMQNLPRPLVSVSTVANLNGDATHCTISVGTESFTASFDQCSCELVSMIHDATDVEISTNEVMQVTMASKLQMVREACRLKAVLAELPRGAMAVLEQDMYIWIGCAGDLLWVEFDEPGIGSAQNTYPRHIEDVGPIDTEEFFAVAEAIRKWVGYPKTKFVDVVWLDAAEA